MADGGLTPEVLAHERRKIARPLTGGLGSYTISGQTVALPPREEIHLTCTPPHWEDRLARYQHEVLQYLVEVEVQLLDAHGPVVLVYRFTRFGDDGRKRFTFSHAERALQYWS